MIDSRMLDNLNFLMASRINIEGYEVELLGVSSMDFPQPWKTNRHSHDFFELHYILSGECRAWLNGAVCVFRPGQYYVSGPGTLHQQISEAHTGFSVRWKLCRTAASGGQHDRQNRVYKYLQGIQRVCCRAIPDDDGRFRGQLEEISGNADAGNTLATQLNLIGLLFTIPDALPHRSGEMGEISASGGGGEAVITSCIQFISEHCTSDLRVQDIATHVHLSYGYLSRLFKRVSGMRLNAQINLIRLYKSQYMLVSGNESLRKVAAQAGFRSENYFVTAFRKQFGCTPGEFRKHHYRLSE